jgi:hypothetical protein
VSISFAVLAAVAGVFVLYLAHRARSRLSLPAGEIVYQDLGGKVSQDRTLVSPQLRLSGKPDLLIETPEGMVPLELKHSGVAPVDRSPTRTTGRSCWPTAFSSRKYSIGACHMGLCGTGAKTTGSFNSSAHSENG